MTPWNTPIYKWLKEPSGKEFSIFSWDILAEVPSREGEKSWLVTMYFFHTRLYIRRQHPNSVKRPLKNSRFFLIRKGQSMGRLYIYLHKWWIFMGWMRRYIYFLVPWDGMVPRTLGSRIRCPSATLYLGKNPAFLWPFKGKFVAGDPLRKIGGLPSKFGVVKGSRIGVGFWMTKKMLDKFWLDLRDPTSNKTTVHHPNTETARDGV